MTPPSETISLFSAVNIVIASMLGAGIYTTSGFTLADLGSPWRVIAAWAVGGLLALCGAISYGALADRFRESGGEYLFLRRAVHPIAGNIAGFVSLLAGFTGALALAAAALEQYAAGVLWPIDAPSPLPAGTLAAIVIVAGALAHGFRLRLGTGVQDSLVVLKLTLLAGILLIAFLFPAQPWRGVATATDHPAPDFSWSTFAVSLMWISLSYSGFNAAIYVTSEVRGSGATVRRALVIGTLLVTGFYLLLNSVFVLAPPAELVTGTADVAARAAAYVGGEWFAWLLRVTILISLATSVLSLTMIGPRVYAKMADDGVLPALFRFSGDLPRWGIIVQAGLAIVAVHLVTLRQLLSYLGLTLSLSAALTVATLFLLRRRGEAVQVPFYPWPPLLFVAGTLTIVGAAGLRQPVEFAVAVATLALGGLLYWVSPGTPTAGSECLNR